MSLSQCLTTTKRLAEDSEDALINAKQQKLAEIRTSKKVELQDYQVQYHDFKNAMRANRFKLFMFQMFMECDYDPTSLTGQNDQLDGPTEADVQGVARELQLLKDKYQSLQEETEDQAYEIESLKEEFDEAHKQLVQSLEELEAKRNKLGAEYDLDKDTLQDDLQSQIERLEEDTLDAQEAQRQAEQTLSALEENVPGHRQQSAHNDLGREHGDQKYEASAKSIEWIRKFSQLTRTTQGVELSGFDREGCTVLIKGDASDSDLALEVKVLVVWRGASEPSLTGAQVNNRDIDVSEVVEKAMSMNSLTHLLTGLRSLWLKHFPLVKEIDTLRHKYAIDWVEAERLLHVMVGTSSKIMCQLRVEPGYPTDGKVTLETVKGGPVTAEHEEVRPANADRFSLTEWLHHLHTVLT